MSFDVSLDPSRLQLDRVHAWLREAYWSPGLRREVMDRAFANSLAAGAYDASGVQLGVARVVTDQATFAWLADVYVDAPARGRGIARTMVRALMADPRMQTLRRWLLATRDAHDVYRPLGFADVEPGLFLEHKLDPLRWSEPVLPDATRARSPGA